jgi:hypothetical protein
LSSGSARSSSMTETSAPIPAQCRSTSLAIHQAWSAGQMNARDRACGVAVFLATSQLRPSRRSLTSPRGTGSRSGSVRQPSARAAPRAGMLAPPVASLERCPLAGRGSARRSRGASGPRGDYQLITVQSATPIRAEYAAKNPHAGPDRHSVAGLWGPISRGRLSRTPTCSSCPTPRSSSR